MTKHEMLLAKALGLVAFVSVWELASRWVGDYWVPGIGQVAGRIWTELLAGKLLADLAATSQLLLAGTSIGAVCGCAVACMLRLAPRLDMLMQPFITAVMSIPKLGLVPLLVLWFGTGWMPKVMLVALTVLFIVFSLTYAGLATVNARLVMTARVFGASSFQLTRHVVVPSVLPFIFTGLQVALPWAVSAALVAEYLAAKAGIGHGIEEARQLSDSVGVYYGIVLATVLVLLCNGVLALVRKLAIKVQP
ncbi:ABC transporter permease [Variovorax boronicumulans]|uniref:ABC transporter permease n=1 Tax=Variovorax boronicumulans TaxID=436515 RepID=UPI002787C5F4|nr:ABC transporter permease [Variovorax boronicumulans]MDQ0044560.1 ABC-type nitrate/sulfonate/bicarbonate transport system permease component [Variovorax boronicumulans]